MLKSLHRKKLDSHFQSVLGFEPTDLQNNTFLQTCAYAHAATELCENLYNHSWCNSDENFQSNFKALSQDSTTTYGKYIGLFVYYFIYTITYLRGKARKCTYKKLRPLKKQFAQ